MRFTPILASYNNLYYNEVACFVEGRKLFFQQKNQKTQKTKNIKNKFILYKII